MRRRGFRDRDFLSSKEGFVFCVVGPYHPSDRVISYLKYLPDPSGTWKKKGGSRFKRVIRDYTISNLLATFSFLEEVSPQYLFFSQHYNIMMTAVPVDCVAEHFEPERKLAELLERSRLDRLQEKTSRFVSLLSNLSNVEICGFGVTGSILLDIHNPEFSDMDITVYGMENSHSLKDALQEACSAGASGIYRFGKERLAKWCLSKTMNHPLTLPEARRISDRKWNTGLFEDTMFSIHPIKLEEELQEKYGDKTYRPVKIVTTKLAVSDSRDSIFLPAVYRVVTAEEEAGVEIEEVVSYEGLYGGLAENGERIKVRGKLEHVTDNRTGRAYYRILVGSPEGKGREYIKPLT